MSFSPREVVALRAIHQALPGIDVVVVGAAALRTTGHFVWRTTSDLDLTVALEIEQYPGPIAQITGFRPDPGMKHRWWMNDLKVDILPAGPGLRRQGHVTWDDHQMSLEGFDLAFKHAVRLTVDDIVVRVAPPPVVMILKMIAYSDRLHDREKDLQDIAYLLEEYIDIEEERRFDGRILGKVQWEHISAHELGYDVGQIVTHREQKIVTDFFLRVRNGDAAGTAALMLRSGPDRWRKNERIMLETCDAFEAGFRSGRTAPGG